MGCSELWATFWGIGYIRAPNTGTLILEAAHINS